MEKLTALFLLFGTIAFYNTHAETSSHVDFSGKASHQNPLFAEAWLPIQHAANHYTFANVNGAISPNQYNGNLEGGGIYRRELNYHWGFGAYTYGGLNRALTGTTFFTLNPGVEVLGEHWHISGNAYLPLGPTHKTYGASVWASDVGIYKYIQFSEHQQYDQLVQPTSSTGPGFDMIASYRIPVLANTEIMGGVYYFNMPTHPVGYGIQLNTPSFKHTSVNIGFLHDPIYGNGVSIGVKLRLGTESAMTNKDWINASVQHNLPQITEANSIPIYSGYRNQGRWQLQQDNIWFFDPNGMTFDPQKAFQNCTYLHPCSNLVNESTLGIGHLSTIGGFQDQPSLYLRPGDYPSANLPLYRNESLIGRSYDYKQPSVDASAHVYTEAIIIEGASGLNTDNTLANLSIYNVGGSFSAIGILNAANVTIDNVQIGGFNLPDVQNNFYQGITILNSQKVTITNSTIMINNDFAGDNLVTYGVNIQGGVANLTISDSAITSQVEGANVDAYGLQVQGPSNITLQNAQFYQYLSGTDATATNIQFFPGVSANLVANQGQFFAEAIGNNTTAQHLIMAGNSQVAMNGASFIATTQSTASNYGTNGFVLYDQSHLSLRGSTVNNQGNSTSGSSYATNVSMHDDSQLDVTDSTLYAAGQSILVSGSTNITTGDNSVASLYSSTLETIMGGGPSTGEPSGAVALWSIDHSKINLYNSEVIAQSLNNQTGALTLQSQDQGAINVTNSILNAYYNYGNDTSAGALSIIAGSSSQITIENSQVAASLMGQSSKDLTLLVSIGTGTIRVTNSELSAINDATPLGPVSLKTIGASAYENSLIFINASTISLIGPDPTVSQTQGSGQVIITN